MARRDSSSRYMESISNSDSEELEYCENLVILAAVEALYQRHSEQGSDTEEYSGSEHNVARSKRSRPRFELFQQLPPELRRRIWELFCPDLEIRSRVLDFRLSLGTARFSDAAHVWTVRDDMYLADVTQPIRTVLAVHRESRGVALQRFPDTLAIDAGSGDAIVRFHKEFDVVLVNGLTGVQSVDAFHLDGFANQAQNVALGEWEGFDRTDPGIVKLMRSFTHLESLFLCTSSNDLSEKNLKWCTSELVNRFHAQTYEKGAGLGENLEILFCWPDLRNHADFARFHINKTEWEIWPNEYDELTDKSPLKVWYLVSFEYQRGLRKYKALCTGEILSDDYDDSGSSPAYSSDFLDPGEDPGTDLDRYESDGLDDTLIPSVYGSSSEDEAGSPSYEAAARFSSPESEPGLEADALPSRGQRRKRAIVSDSDDEVEEVDGPTSKKARVSHVIEISSDEESDVPHEHDKTSRQKRRARAVLANSDDESSAYGGHEVPAGAGTRNDSDNDSGSSASESSADGDSADGSRRPMSLVDRLRLQRERHPVPPADDGDSGTGEEEEGQEGTIGIWSEEEDEGEEESDSEDGMALKMAAESSAGSEDGDDDY